jgi:hypothetical protein
MFLLSQSCVHVRVWQHQRNRLVRIALSCVCVFVCMRVSLFLSFLHRAPYDGDAVKGQVL